MAKKRPRDEEAEDTEALPRGPATIGQQTSHIKNKLVRAELYAKLKHKQKVRQPPNQHPESIQLQCRQSLAARRLHTSCSSSSKAGAKVSAPAHGLSLSVHSSPHTMALPKLAPNLQMAFNGHLMPTATAAAAAEHQQQHGRTKQNKRRTPHHAGALRQTPVPRKQTASLQYCASKGLMAIINNLCSRQQEIGGTAAEAAAAAAAGPQAVTTVRQQQQQQE